MSTVSFTSNKQGIQDLLASLPAPSSGAADRSRKEDAGQSDKPGFVDLLRDSSQSRESSKRAEPAEAIDTPARGDSQQGEEVVADKAEDTNKGTQAKESQDESSQDSSDNSDKPQADDQAKSDTTESKPAESSDEAQLQAAANAAAAELNVLDAVATDQPKVRAQANANQQIDLSNVKQSTSNEQSGKQTQANASNLALNAPLPSQAQSATGQVAQGTAVATTQPVLQPGDNGQANSGDARGDSKASTASTAVNTNATSSSNAAATTAFALPEQGGSDARLPINPTGTTPTVDASRMVQTQSAIGNSDNDALNTSRLTRGLANAVQQRGGTVTMRLTPPEMGTVRIQMQITGASVSATFHAESASAQTLLTNQLAQLRSSLESKGMSVERLTVQPLATTASSSNTNQSQNQSDSQQQGQAQQQSAGDGRSRGQYSGDSSGRGSADQQRDNGSSQQAPRGFFERLNDAAEPQAA